VALICRAEVEVPAPPERVWAVLVDFEAYGSWNHFNPRVQTLGEVGASVTLRVRLHGVLVPAWMRIRELSPPHRLVWGLSAGPILWAERVQSVEVAPAGARYVTVDTIGGLMSPLVALFFRGALQEGFAQMVDDLATHSSWSTPDARPPRR